MNMFRESKCQDIFLNDFVMLCYTTRDSDGEWEHWLSMKTNQQIITSKR